MEKRKNDEAGISKNKAKPREYELPFYMDDEPRNPYGPRPAKARRPNLSYVMDELLNPRGHKSPTYRSKINPSDYAFPKYKRAFNLREYESRIHKDKVKPDERKVRTHGIWPIVLIAAGVVGLAAMSTSLWLIRAVFYLMTTLAGTVFDFIAGLMEHLFLFVATIFGVVGVALGELFEMLGDALGVLLGTMTIWLPILMIIGGLALLIYRDIKNE